MTEDFYAKLGKEIQRLRKASKKTQKEVAEAVDLSQPDLSAFEKRGDKIRSAAKINAILEFLGYKFDIAEKKTLLPST